MTRVVLLPGMDGSGTLFADFASALSMPTQVVRYSAVDALDYSQLESVVAQQLPNEPYVLLAESFSGPIAIRLAATRPAHLRAVVLVCTFATLAKRRAPSWVHAALSQLPFWRLPIALGATRLLGQFDSAPLRMKLAAAIADVRPAVWRRRMLSVLDVDVTSQLRSVTVPLLYLRASDDRVVPARAGDIICKTAQDIYMRTVEGPHALLQTQPVACAAVIHEFFRRHEIA